MPMKIDHVTLGVELSNRRAMCLALCNAASASYPYTSPLVQSLVSINQSLESLQSELDRVYRGEANDPEIEVFGRPYLALGALYGGNLVCTIADSRPAHGKRKRRFNKEEVIIARQCLVEIGGGLEYARGLLSKYGPRSRVNVFLRFAKDRCDAAGLNLGLAPANAPLAG